MPYWLPHNNLYVDSYIINYNYTCVIFDGEAV